MIGNRLIITGIIGMLATGCTSLPKDHYFVCPYDTVWEAAVDTMTDQPITIKNKDKGLIETGWTEMAAKERSFGVFARDAFDNKERARMSVSLKPLNDVTEVSVIEMRQRWHLRGGVTQQATKWWPIEPSEEAMTAVMDRINLKLKDRGCSHG